MHYKVCKFGGTSVATTEKIQQIEHILSQDTTRRCVVLSAPGKAPGASTKVTDLLIAVVKKRIDGSDAKTELDSVRKRYCEIYVPLGIAEAKVLEAVSILEKRVAASTADSAKYRDAVVATGEDLSARLFAEYLSCKGTKAVYISPQDAGLIVTANFGDAQPVEGAYERLAKLAAKCDEAIVIFPGFFGFTEAGDIATFSRGGSDLTGAILAGAMDAVEYENFTDVDGIFSANPNVVADPVLIPALTYREMRELSYMGFNVLHEEAVRPVMARKIPIRLRNTGNLKNEGTLIVSERLPGERDIIGIAGGGRFCSFNLQKFLMNREKGFGRRLLSIFEDMGLSYEHCPSGVDNISVVIDQDQLRPESVNNLLRTIEEQLAPDEIKVEFGIALIAVVGEGLLHKVGVLGQAANALSRAGVNIKLANQGSSELSMIFGIDAIDEDRALNALYAEFFSK